VASFALSGVELSGLACAVPENKVDLNLLSERFGEEEARRISESIGISSRPIAPEGLCSSDLCFAAAEKLLGDLEWERKSIDAVIFVSQTPDHQLPATACFLQNRLQLPSSCLAFDVNLGCSGYVYGLSIASQFISSGSIKRALVLVGDTLSHLVSNQDKSTSPLFGDAGTATALQHRKDAPAMTFTLGTDGRGAQHLIIPAGMHRRRRSEETSTRTEYEGGNIRSEEELFMDGAQVFSFTLAKIPKLVRSALDAANWTMDEVDAVVMHQANAFMLTHLAKRLKIPNKKFVLAMEDYGNTSCASIPLAINSALTDQLSQRSMRLLLVGFGVGWSWGAMSVSCGPMVVPEVVQVPCSLVAQ
jgi:3-oxoacyl-[acyl-carrier-protein] synthase-3